MFRFCLTALLIAVVTFIVFLPAVKNSFVNWDDVGNIIHNQHIHLFNGELFRWAFLEFYDDSWFPLTYVSLAVDYVFWGADPRGYHLTNVILHACNTFWVPLVTMRLIDAYRSRMNHQNAQLRAETDRIALVSCVAAGLLFGLHPLRVESVAWVSERKDVLNAFFCLPAFFVYLCYAQRRVEANSNLSFWLFDKRYLAALLLFILSLLSKPMTVTLPVILLIIDWFPLRRLSGTENRKAVIAEKIPFLLASLAVSVITLISQRPDMAMQETVWSRVLLACKSVVSYLRMILWPSGLSPSYPFPHDTVSFARIEYGVPVVLVALITIVCLLMVRRQKIWFAVWFSFLVALSPVLMVVKVGMQAMADRYTYLPCLGPVMLVSLGGGMLFNKASKAKRWSRPLGYGVIAAIMAVAAVYSVMTMRQIGVWRNTGTLWTRVIELKPDGLTYFQRGRYYEVTGEYENALSDYTESIRFALVRRYSKIHELYFFRANVYAKMGRYGEALGDYNRSINLNPAPTADDFIRRGTMLQTLGRLKEANDDFVAAKAIGK